MSENPHNVPHMVATYKKLFLVLALVTAIGIGLTYISLPVGAMIIIGLIFMAFKSRVVWNSFQSLLTGPAKTIMLLLLAFTVINLIGLLVIPTMNHQNLIKGTEDISKELQEEQKPLEAHHGH